MRVQPSNDITGFAAIATKTTGYSLTSADWLILGDTTSGAFTLTLPTAVGIQGKEFVLKNIGTKVLTIATTSSQTIDGITTYKLNGQYNSINVISDNANWIII